ncbi:hypothetical protein PHMEG_00041184, partial [Phytophthora megakarya]
RALRHIRSARQQLGATKAEHLCVNLDAATMTRVLKKAAVAAKVCPRNYATHSLRIGGASALMNGHIDSLSIKLLGRWVSRCYEEYPVQAAAATKGLAGRMV